MSQIRKIRVVIIEDFEMTRTLLKIILRGDEFEVVGEAGDGLEGVQLCQQLQPDMVFIDVIMPKLNGLDALPEIRAILPHANIIMVTGNEDEDVVSKAMQLGANAYIVKPFNSASVLETMQVARQKFILRNPAMRGT
ncbi:MAG: response regulator [Burkholderiaceae bacterium]|nr:response regulator [Burkholderiaceae bacterium]